MEASFKEFVVNQIYYNPNGFSLVAGALGGTMVGLAVKGFGVKGKGFINPNRWAKPGIAKMEERLYLGFIGSILLFAAGLLLYDTITRK